MADDEQYGEAPSPEEVAALVTVLGLALDRYIRNRARRTIAENAKADPAKPKLRWQAAPDACDFCKSRGSFLMEPGETVADSHRGCKCFLGTIFRKDGRKRDNRSNSLDAEERPLVKPKDQEKNHYTVDYDAVNSGEHKKAFDTLPYSYKARHSLRRECGRILEENDGTRFETIVAIDSKTGRRVADSRDHPAIESKAWFSESANKKIGANKNPVIVIHNHPGSSYPSGTDCIAACKRENAVGSVVACHNGDVYNITPNHSFGIETFYAEQYHLYLSKGCDKKTAELMADARLFEENESRLWFKVTKQ